MSIKRRSLFKALFLGAAIAFPATRLRLSDGTPLDDEFTHDVANRLAREFLSHVKVARLFAAINPDALGKISSSDGTVTFKRPPNYSSKRQRD